MVLTTRWCTHGADGVRVRASDFRGWVEVQSARTANWTPDHVLIVRAADWVNFVAGLKATG